jgi:hypothetical protein
MPFRVKGLDRSQFEPFFALGDAGLEARGMRRLITDAKPGFPCRVSLEDAAPGERVLLLGYEHQPSRTPFRASGPIFVREAARAVFDGVDELPPVFAGRLLSLRAYDAEGMMVDADVVEGSNAEGLIARLLARADTEYLHAHYARRGCYACRIER